MKQFCRSLIVLLVLLMQGWQALQGQGLQDRKGHCSRGIDAFAKIEAEDMDYTSGVEPGVGNGIGFVGDIQQGDVMGFYDVDFRDGAIGLRVRVALDVSSILNQVHLRLDSIRNPPFVTVDVGPTGSYWNYTTLSLFLTHVPTGRHDLYFTFTKQTSPLAGGVLNIDWFQFFKTLPQ